MTSNGDALAAAERFRLVLAGLIELQRLDQRLLKLATRHSARGSPIRHLGEIRELFSDEEAVLHFFRRAGQEEWFHPGLIRSGQSQPLHLRLGR